MWLGLTGMPQTIAAPDTYGSSRRAAPVLDLSSTTKDQIDASEAQGALLPIARCAGIFIFAAHRRAADQHYEWEEPQWRLGAKILQRSWSKIGAPLTLCATGRNVNTGNAPELSCWFLRGRA